MLSAQSSQNNVHATLSPFSWPGVRHTPPCSFSCSVFLLGLLGLILGDLLLLQAQQELQVLGVLQAFVNGGHGPLVHLLSLPSWPAWPHTWRSAPSPSPTGTSGTRSSSGVCKWRSWAAGPPAQPSFLACLASYLAICSFSK